MRIKRSGARWEVTQFVEEHTHEFVEKFALKKFLRSHNKIPKEEKKFIDLLSNVNLSSGRIMQIMAELYGSKQNVPYSTKTISNYRAQHSEERKIKDIPELLKYFEKLKEDDPRFYYDYKLDDDNRVENIFWVDGAARDVYKLYNDCISFDTTFMTNQYNMPCAPFIGINRYGQSIQLGCGFLRNEKVANFEWLFRTFLVAMDGLHPLNIITDQDVAMRTAIEMVFPDTIHRNCRWHIMQKVQEKIGPMEAKREDLRRDFNDVIDYSVTEEEFETRWAEMIQKHDVVDNDHFKDIYDLRKCFVPAYFMKRFFPFLQTTACSEGFNAVLKQYISPHESLLNFFKQYMKLQEKIDSAEDGHDFMGMDKLELRKITSYNARDCGGGVFEVFPVQGTVYGYGRRTYVVDVDLENLMYNCQCCKFYKDGILCCHIMKVMSYIGEVREIPEHYTLPRWSLPPPDIVPSIVEPVQRKTGKMSRKDMRLLRYGNLCNDFSKLAVGLAVSEKTKEIADKHMIAMRKELAALKKANADALKRRKNKSVATEDISDSSPFEGRMDEDVSQSINKKAKDPPVTAAKGRPCSKRKKGGLQLKKPNPTTCSVCGEIDHDARNCPVRLANPEKIPFHQFFQ
ncbi:protein FAR1-RELATED SEQUENCE 5-like [Lolium perenne]|uniref:protein FAR1-RELATED SEQUENCE 5-like n=1 Tax=Lolium perenne TaxID=4522 RepID=UPI0021F5818F|nr:protein FAR1-RELATED SEQUENCE 5-like [Lolium perenne]